VRKEASCGGEGEDLGEQLWTALGGIRCYLQITKVSRVLHAVSYRCVRRVGQLAR